MNPRRFLSLLPLAVFVACTDDGPTAGTNDEVTTSLQILADNVRSIPAATSNDGAGAARIAATPDTGWNIVEMVDHGSWSAWRIVGRTPTASTDSGYFTYSKTSHANDSTAYIEAVETYVKDTAGVRHVDFEAVIRNRSGFLWRVTQDIALKASGDWGRGFTRTGRLEFPSLGLHCEYSVEETDDESYALLALLQGGLPLLNGDGRVGTFAIDSTTGSMTWRDLEGRVYTPHPVPFASNAQDSFGLRVTDVVRISRNGSNGLRIDGRFRLPDRYGLRADTMDIFHSQDSLKFPGAPSPVSAPFAAGDFSIIAGTEMFGDVAPAWIQTRVVLHPQQNPSITSGSVRSPILKVR